MWTMTTTIQWVKVMKSQLVGLQTNGEILCRSREEADSEYWEEYDAEMEEENGS